MHKDLWAGIELKLRHSEFHIREIEQSLMPDQAEMAYADASVAMIGTDWQLPFYAHFDAFLSVVRSVPEIIRCCFGTALANRAM